MLTADVLFLLRQIHLISILMKPSQRRGYGGGLICHTLFSNLPEKQAGAKIKALRAKSRDLLH